MPVFFGDEINTATIEQSFSRVGRGMFHEIELGWPREVKSHDDLSHVYPFDREHIRGEMEQYCRDAYFVCVTSVVVDMRHLKRIAQCESVAYRKIP